MLMARGTVAEFGWALASSLPALACTLILKDLFDGSEFAGGVVTGPLLQLLDAAIAAFLVSLMLAVHAPRVSAVICLMGAAFCLPLYTYRVLPDLFFFALPPVKPQSFMQFDLLTILALCFLILPVFKSVTTLVARHPNTPGKPT